MSRSSPSSTSTRSHVTSIAKLPTVRSAPKAPQSTVKGKLIVAANTSQATTRPVSA